MNKSHKPKSIGDLTTEEFKERIARIRGASPDRILGAKHAHKSLVRRPGDRGYRKISIRPGK